MVHDNSNFKNTIIITYNNSNNIVLQKSLTSLGSIHKTSTLSSLAVNLNRAELSLTSGVTVLTQAVLLLGGR